MRFKVLVLHLLITSLVIMISAEEFKDTKVIALNHSSFLPYTLKSQNNNAAEDESNQHVNLLKEYQSKDQPPLREYEDSSKINRLPESNGWKRLTTILPTPATISKQQDLTYFCKSSNLQRNSLIGPFYYVLAQIIFLLLHLGVLSYILFGSVALFHRLLYLSQGPKVKHFNEDLSDQFYKSEL